MSGDSLIYLLVLYSVKNNMDRHKGPYLVLKEFTKAYIFNVFVLKVLNDGCEFLPA